MNNVDFSKVVPATEMEGESEHDTALLRQMLKEAHDYLMSFKWCEDICESYFGLGIGGVVAVFLFRINPSREDVDEWLWVVVGDLPAAYLVTDGSPTPAEALETYVEEMKAWVVAVEEGRSVEDIIPVNVSPTPENADALERRLTFLKVEIIPRFGDQKSPRKIQ